MNRRALIKISIFAVSIAIILSLASLLFLNRATHMQGAQFRNDFLSFFASSLDLRLREVSLEQVPKVAEKFFSEEPSMRPPFPPPPPPGPNPREGRPPFRPPPPDSLEDRFARGERPPPPPMMMPPPDMPPPPSSMIRRLRGRPDKERRPPQMWLVDERGKILARNEVAKAELPWSSLPKSRVPGEVVSGDDFFRLAPSFAVVRLEYPTPLYLVFRDPRPPFFGTLLTTQAVLTSSMIVIALIFALGILFFYLRRKSEEARVILRRLEQGDLKARFEIKRFDEFGELMLDFNRMAGEIETLVGRIHATEGQRKKLMQELGHDLRTPLTSLKTNLELLQNHHDKLSTEQRIGINESLLSEVDYLKDLIEKLILISSLDEPHYKASTEVVDLQELLQSELEMRKQSVDNKLRWELRHNQTQTVIGDRHLLTRLVRNALDNAARYARTQIEVTLTQNIGKLVVDIKDDGEGVSEETIKNFGQRKEFQGRRLTKNGHYSLGLGSIIMRTIAELHHGEIEIKNIKSDDNAVVGAHLRISLKN